PFWGMLTGLAYLGFILLFLAMLTRDTVNLASMYFLVSTPTHTLALLYLLAAAWLASRGIETITRTASLERVGKFR
ncbi:MAG: GerAB/ArcD/ProY family transporter, partial [Patescibacteria group bacterium]